MKYCSSKYLKHIHAFDLKCNHPLQYCWMSLTTNPWWINMPQKILFVVGPELDTLVWILWDVTLCIPSPWLRDHLLFALCEQFWQIRILGPVLRQKRSPFCQKLGLLITIFGSPCDWGTSDFVISSLLNNIFLFSMLLLRAYRPGLTAVPSKLDFRGGPV